MSSNIAALVRSKPSFAVLATASAAGVLVWSQNTTSFLEQPPSSSKEEQKKEDRRPRFRIETDLMERIANKPYLQATTKQLSRPKGVPRRLRVMAIDVLPVRYAFDGECGINLSRTFLDDVAPPKKSRDNHNNNGNKSNSNQPPIVQKSIAKALIKCRKNKKIGVELLEVSVADLNPHNLRKTHQFGNYRYDPGKYSSNSNATEKSQATTTTTTDNNNKDPTTEKEEARQEDTINNKPAIRQGIHIEKDDEEGNAVPATEEDMLDAPWNQYAWIEELEMRIHGKIPFGDTLVAASPLSRMLFGTVYKSTVPSSRRLWEWFLPPFLHSDPAGTETGLKKLHNWASHKPHAVIADGAALQRVPGSLRFLQRTCQEANVPLYVLNDPRVWGGNTHQDLEQALHDMRKAVKYRIIQQAMLGSGGSAFARGRFVGQLETETRWKAKDMGRRTRQAIKDANQRLEQERDRDWSQLDAQRLKTKLVQHKVIRQNKPQTTTTYSNGMMELAQQCVQETTDASTFFQDDDETTTTDIDPSITSETPADVVAA